MGDWFGNWVATWFGAVDTGGGGGGGGTGGGAGGGPGTYPLPPGLTSRQKKAYAALLACAPCCESGSGSGSGSGVPMPNGCSPCDCCPCICWWYTTWHKLISASSFMYNFGAPSPVWTLINNTVAKVGGDPDYMYLANIGVGDCTLAGLFAVDENGDITDELPYVPQWTGDLTYTSIHGTVTFNVTFTLQFTISFPCENPYEAADAVVWFGSAVNSSSDPNFTFNGGSIKVEPLGPFEPVDTGMFPNANTGVGTIIDCGGTLILGGSMPNITFTPMRDPDCVE